MKELYKDVISKKVARKGLLYYWEEWARMFYNVKEMRRKAGKRSLPKTPPVLVPVRFVMPDGSVRGDKNAPCVIDLRRGELRIPSYGIVEGLRKSLVRALVEENTLEPRPEFVLMVTRVRTHRSSPHSSLRISTSIQGRNH